MKAEKAKKASKSCKSRQLEFQFQFNEDQPEMAHVRGKRGRYFSNEVYRELCAMMFLN
jgi:hypothetical protein